MTSNEKTVTENNAKKGTPIGIKIAGYIFAFVLSVCIVIFASSLIVRSALSTNALLSCVPSYYYSSLKDDILIQCEDYTLPTGIDPSVLSDVFTEEQVKNDVIFSITNSDPGSTTLDTSELEAHILSNVEKFFAEQDVEIDESALGNLDDYAKEISDIYKRSVKLPGIDYITRIRTKFGQIMIYILIVTLLLGMACAILCLKLIPSIKRGFRYVTEAIGGAGLMMIALPLIMLINRFYEHLNIRPDYFADTIASYVRNGLIKFILTGVVMLVIYIVCSIVLFLKKK